MLIKLGRTVSLAASPFLDGNDTKKKKKKYAKIGEN